MGLFANFYLQDKKKIKRDIELSMRSAVLRDLRATTKKTQKDVASEANVSINAVRLMEAGETYSESIYNTLLDYYMVDKDSKYRTITVTEKDYLDYHYLFLLDNFINHIETDITTSIFLYINNYYKDNKLVNSLLYLFGNNQLSIPEDCRRNGPNHKAIAARLNELEDEFKPIISELLSSLPTVEKSSLNFEYEALMDYLRKEKTISIPILSEKRINEIVKKVTIEFTETNKDYNSARLLKSILDQMGGVSSFAKQQNIGTTNLYNMVNGESPISEDIIDRIANSKGLSNTEYKRLIDNKEQDLFNQISEYIWSELTFSIYGPEKDIPFNYNPTLYNLLGYIEKNFENVYKIEHDYFNYNFGHYKSKNLHIEKALIFLILNGIDISKINVNELIKINTRLSIIYKQITDKYKDVISAVSKVIITIKDINIDKTEITFTVDHQTIKKINNNHY